MAKKGKKAKGIPTTVPDAVLSETGACLVPLTEGRIAALAGGGQDVTGLVPAENEDGFDVDADVAPKRKSR
jgi:hypothetical protein